MDEKEYPAILRLKKEAVIGKRHVWLWYIESENGVINAWLLQWEEEGMNIIDKLYTYKEEVKAFKAFEKKIKEIIKEVWM